MHPKRYKRHNYREIYELQETNKRLRKTILIMVFPFFCGLIWNFEVMLDYITRIDWFSEKTVVLEIREEKADVSDDKDELVPADSLPFVSVGSGSAPSATAPSSITDKIKEVFGADADVAIAIAMAESRLIPDRVGDTHLTFEKDGRTYGASYGLFQIRDLPGRIDDPEKLKNPDFNIRFAKELFDKSGFYPWSTYKNNQYLAYL